MQSDIARVIASYSAQGIHRTGTETDIESAHWLASEVRRAGLEPLLNSFVFDRFNPIDAHVEVAGQRIHGMPFYDCEPGQERI